MPARPQLWEVSSGELLLSVLFDVGIMAVTMDLAEHHMFCGGSDGSIFQVDLCTWVSGRGRWGARAEAVPWPLLTGPPGLRSLGSERRASSRSRTAGRCSEGTGAGMGLMGPGWRGVSRGLGSLC